VSLPLNSCFSPVSTVSTATCIPCHLPPGGAGRVERTGRQVTRGAGGSGNSGSRESRESSGSRESREIWAVGDDGTVAGAPSSALSPVSGCRTPRGLVDLRVRMALRARSILVTCASGGPLRSSFVHAVIASRSASPTASTLRSGRLRTQPTTPYRFAAERVNQRKPTPWTRPFTTTWMRMRSGAVMRGILRVRCNARTRLP
jgi:hypothetical protein